jgi:membrane protein
MFSSLRSKPSKPVTATLSDSSEEGAHVLPSAQPPSAVPPGGGWWEVINGLVRYLVQSEVHTYAFSVAANTILSIVPFIILMYFLARHVFHSLAMEAVIGEMVHFFLPTGQSFVVQNMKGWVSRNQHLPLISVITLFISCTGVFLPLEVALNRVWGVTKNRSYLKNQIVALSLAVLMVVLAMGSVLLGAVQRSLLAFVFFHHIDNPYYRWVVKSWTDGTTVLAGVLLFFFIYWLLPNRKLPAKAVIPTAIVTGLLWAVAKYLYKAALPYLDLDPKDGPYGSYGPFYISVGLILWGYVSGLLMLGGAHYSATRYTLRMAHQADIEEDLAKQTNS